MSPLSNFLLFQLGWFGCVLGGAHQLPWLGTGLVAILLGWHLSRSHRPHLELALALIAALIGAVWDSILVARGWLVYPSGTLIENTAPHWIVAMWMLLATTLNVSLRWFKQRLLIASLSGAVAGPLAYYAGAQLGGVVVADSTAAFTALAAGWALFMPLLLFIARRLDGTRPMMKRDGLYCDA
jgi:hypothetical protein